MTDRRCARCNRAALRDWNFCADCRLLVVSAAFRRPEPKAIWFLTPEEKAAA